MDTAGRSVLFAGSTVVIALLGMLLLGISFLNGPAIAAALAVALTMVGSLTLLPALLGAFGRRVKFPSIGRRGARVAALGALQRAHRAPPARVRGRGRRRCCSSSRAPVTGMRLGSSDAGSDVASSTTRQAYDLLAQGFGAGFNGPLLVVAEVDGGAGRSQLDALATTLRSEPGVAAVTRAGATTARATRRRSSLFPSSKPQDAATEGPARAAARRRRAAGRAGPGCASSIGGATASTVDMSSVLSSKLPLFVLVVVGTLAAAARRRLPVARDPGEGRGA